MTLDLRDTIAAIASPTGPALRGIVRLSGPEAFSIARQRFTPDRDAAPPRGPRLESGRIDLAGQRRALPASLASWPGPRTYTGEPLVEIHTVGSPPLLQAVLAGCLDRGARLAQRGEFTLRAFLSGRIDLTQAEAVLGVIEADNAPQLRTALAQLAGGLAGPIRTLRDRLLDLVAHLEAGLDFVDEADVDPLARAALADELREGAETLRALAARLQARDRPDGRPRVVLVGPPNAGKSRLFNALLGERRAIVSPRAGTTRDYLTAAIEWDGVPIELVDTAGQDAAADDPIEAQAQALRADQEEAADLLLVCRAADDPGRYPAALRQPHHLVWTKADLAEAPPGSLATSAVTGRGLVELRATIADLLRRAAGSGDAVASTGARCRVSLARAGHSLVVAVASCEQGAGDELVALDLRQAVDELGKVVGAVFTDDILDRIFSRFSIGT
jgi:tRNA modification GTPase